MVLFVCAIIAGLVLLVWSADRFITGATATAGYAGMPPLVIGMVVVGFGTSAPEMVVSLMAALDGRPKLALGNALGSNIVNIGLIVGITALIAPMAVHSRLVRRELPLLLVITLTTGMFLADNALTRVEALGLVAGFVVLMGWTLYVAVRRRDEVLETQTGHDPAAPALSRRAAGFWLVAGLILLILSSRLLVWGAVNVAEALGVGSLIIGLTIVALGTSLPELASSLIAARRSEHDLALGNVVGSNLFNILAVLGLAGAIAPVTDLDPAVFTRDWTTLAGLTVLLFAFAYGFRRAGRIRRPEAGALLLAFVGYNLVLVLSALRPA